MWQLLELDRPDLSDDTVVIFTDMDEIPKGEVMAAMKHCQWRTKESRRSEIEAAVGRLETELLRDKVYFILFVSAYEEILRILAAFDAFRCFLYMDFLRHPLEAARGDLQPAAGEGLAAWLLPKGSLVPGLLAALGLGAREAEERQHPVADARRLAIAGGRRHASLLLRHPRAPHAPPFRSF